VKIAWARASVTWWVQTRSWRPVLETVLGLGMVLGPDVGDGVAAAEFERDAVVDFPLGEAM
jgi:hypothetical protein